MLHRLLDHRQGSLEDVDARGEGKASNNLSRWSDSEPRIPADSKWSNLVTVVP